MSQPMTDPEAMQAAVQAHYGARIQIASSCCGSGAASCCGGDPTELTLYGAEALALLPSDVVTTSYGYENSLALAALQPGESALDLGSGGGLEVRLPGRQPGLSSDAPCAVRHRGICVARRALMAFA